MQRRNLVFLLAATLFMFEEALCQEIIKNKDEVKKTLGSSAVVLQKDLVLGDENRDGLPLFESLRSFRVDEAGNIYVIDDRACKLLKFDQSGNLEFSKGRKGQGPGEFQFPSIIELGKNNTIMIYDLGNRRISYFSNTGDLVEEISTGKIPRLFRIDDDSKGNFYGTTILNDGDRRYITLNEYDSNLNLGKVLSKLEENQTPNEVSIFPPNILFRVLDNDQVLWADNFDYILHLSDRNGERIKEIHKEYKAVKITDADRKREIELRYGQRKFPPEIKLIFPENYPPIDHLLIDNVGDIFVRTYEKDEKGAVYYDYFNRDGKHICKFPLEIAPFVIHKDHIFSIETDEKGGQRIVRYKYNLKMGQQ